MPVVALLAVVVAAALGGCGGSGNSGTGVAVPGESAAQWMRFLGEVSPGLLATGSCVLVILLFERLGHVFAVVTATVLMFVAAVGLLRRVPCAGALAFGVIIAGLLIRVS